MGLDMYLKKEIYIGNQHKKPEEQIKIIVPEGSDIKINQEKVSYISEDVAYWRKANQIHRWMVENCQEGEDDCGEYDVSLSQLKILLGLVNKVLEDKSLAEELLPVQEGFFFGSYEYDEWYFKGLEDTKIMLEKIIKEDNGSGDYIYCSSW